MTSLDSDLLRTFIAVAEAGSVTEGAARVHRSQSAASLQIKRLEKILRKPVFDRHGRGVALSDAGRYLLPVARDVTARLDAALRELGADGLRGKLRIGIPDDHGRTRLAQIIGTFAQSHPLVELEVTCALSAGFAEDLAKGRLDLAVYEVQTPAPGEQLLCEDPTCWVSTAYRDIANETPLPVALFDHACWWRDAALASLQARGAPFRVVYSSQSVSGVVAAVQAGVAVGLLGRSSLGPGLSQLGVEHGFERTPMSSLVLGRTDGHDRETVSAMASAIDTAFRG